MEANTPHYTIKEMCYCFNTWQDGLGYDQKPSKFANLRWDNSNRCFYLEGHSLVGKITTYKDSFAVTKLFSGAVSAVSKAVSSIAYSANQSEVYDKISEIANIFASTISSYSEEIASQDISDDFIAMIYDLRNLSRYLKKFNEGIEQIQEGYSLEVRKDDGDPSKLFHAKKQINTLMIQIRKSVMPNEDSPEKSNDLSIDESMCLKAIRQKLSSTKKKSKPLDNNDDRDLLASYEENFNGSINCSSFIFKQTSEEK